MDLGTFVGGLSGIVSSVTLFYTASLGVPEYRRQGRIARAERYVEIRRSLEEIERFRKIWTLIDNEHRMKSGWTPRTPEEDPQRLALLPRSDREDYLGRFEEVSLLVEAKLLKPEIAHYMFGWRVMRTWESERFREDLEQDKEHDPYFRAMRTLYNRSVALDKRWRETEPKDELGF